jgi:hypothetical protein
MSQRGRKKKINGKWQYRNSNLPPIGTYREGFGNSAQAARTKRGREIDCGDEEEELLEIGESALPEPVIIIVLSMVNG